MTLIAPIGGGANAQTANPMLGSLGGDAFLKLLVAQLRYQNPMSPTDPSSMLQQTAQFTQVETMQQLAASQQQMLGLSAASMANGMVGDRIAAGLPDGTVVTGIVEAVRFTADGPVLTVAGADVPLTAVTEIGVADPSDPSDPTDPTDSPEPPVVADPAAEPAA